MVAPGFSPACAALKGGSTVNAFSQRNTRFLMLRADALAGLGKTVRGFVRGGPHKDSSRL